jgi:hypothetical protein
MSEAKFDFDNIPQEYTPSSLRKQEEKRKRPDKTTYATGNTSDGKSFGMTHGPTEILDEMLEVVPVKEKDSVPMIIAYAGKDDDFGGFEEVVILIWNKNHWRRVDTLGVKGSFQDLKFNLES